MPPILCTTTHGAQLPKTGRTWFDSLGACCTQTARKFCGSASAAGEHRFLECSGTQGSNSSRASRGGRTITPELRVTLGSNLSNPGSTWSLKSMFKLWGSGTLCSNPEFGNSSLLPGEFEPWVRELHARIRGLGTLCWNPGFWWFSPSPQKVRTLGSGTLCSNLGFGEVYVGLRSLELLPPRVRTLVRKLHAPSNFKE